MKFYLYNYKALHHLFGLVSFYFLFRLISIDLFDKPLLGLFILAINLPISNWILNKVGLHEQVKKELKQLVEREIK